MGVAMKFQAPVHGGRVFEAARALNIPWHEIIDFSANINPLGQPKGLKKAIFNDFERSLHYPELQAQSLLAKLEEITGLSSAHFLAGAGSTPHLFLLPRALGMGAPVIIGPAFAEYEAGLSRAGLQTQYINTRETDEWQLKPDILDRVFNRKPGAIFLANPANPTGRIVPADLMYELAERCARREVWLVVDEAFIDFTESGRTVLKLVKRNQRLIVLRSLTKIFAIPGLRLAYLAAHPQVIAKLAHLIEPWAVSSPSLSAGLYCLEQGGFIEATLKGLRVFRHHLVKGLNDVGIGRVFPSEANFVLMKLREIFKARDLIEYLLHEGILIRDASNFNGLKSGYLRLAVRPVAETAALLSALKHFIGQGDITKGGPPQAKRGF